MAQVDFTNAVLDVNPNAPSGHTNPMEQYPYLGISASDWYFTNAEDSRIVDNVSGQIISSTPAKVSIQFNGTFTASGTEMYRYWMSWKISNISFSAGDTYSFIVDI